MQTEDSYTDNDLYFSKQMINNACATQAIINILLNCRNRNINIGQELNN